MKMKINVDAEKGSIFLESNNEVGFNRQKTLKINVSDIVILSLTTKMEFDDEQIYITLVGEDCEIYHINFLYFNKQLLDLLDDKFGFTYDTSLITDADYEKGRSKIVYPLSLRGKGLYQSNFRSVITYWDLILRNLRIRQPAGGVLSEEVNKFLQEL